MEIPKVNAVSLQSFEELFEMFAKVLGGMSDLPSPVMDIGVEFGVNLEASTLPVQLTQIFLRRAQTIHPGYINHGAAVFLEEV